MVSSTRQGPGSQPVDKAVDRIRVQTARTERTTKAGTVEQTTADLGAAWRSVVDDLQPNQRAWLRASEPVTLHESTAIIAVPNDFTRSQLEGRLRGQLEDALTVAFGREIRIAVTVNPALGRLRPADL